MKKELFKETFMSWDNGYGTKERAVALCGADGSFYQAINYMGDSDMGEKGPDGVYDRIWYADEIRDAENIRPATYDEVCKYLKHCSVEDEAEECCMNIEHIFFGYDRSEVYFSYKKVSWYRKLVAKVREWRAMRRINRRIREDMKRIEREKAEREGELRKLTGGERRWMTV